MLIDEPEEELGTKLVLPAQYERYRDRIEASLEALEEPYKTRAQAFENRAPE